MGEEEDFGVYVMFDMEPEEVLVIEIAILLQ